MEEKTLFDFLDIESEKQKVSNDWKWTFSDYPKEKNGLKVFSCFSCGGGSTMGYKLAGCEVVGCCEIDPEMMEIYKTNHNPRFPFLMDLRDFNKTPDEELPEELFDLDVLDGSPPCTTFSVAGQREETWGKKKKFREGQAEQTLDDLSFVFLDTVEKLKPKVVIMENVEGLVLGEAWEYVQRIYKRFSDAGYFVHHWLLKGERMGIPQKRHRVFFVAARSDLMIDPSWFDMSFNYKPITYGEIKEGTGKPIKTNTQQYKMICKATPEDKRVADIYKRLGEKERCFGTNICWDHNVLHTITGKYTGIRPNEKTFITEQDVIHSQTFPEDFNFVNPTLAFVCYVCGMSVPPVMMKRLIERLIEQGLFDYKLKADS